jgi:glucokinase-like ROK family protein
LLGVSVSVPGLVDQNTGNVLLAPNMGWHDIPLFSVLQEAFPDTPIFVDNEANVAALGEYFFGVARDYSEILYLSAGVGLGGAMVINGRVFRGRTGVAGEFGHMTMEPNGKLCTCGNRGCWETLVSQQALFDHIRAAVNNIDDTSQLSIQTVFLAAQAGDELARDAFAEIGRCLGIGAASLVNALNPDLVMLGGTMCIAGEFILPALRQELTARAMRWNEAATDVVLAQYGTDASLMGGVAKVFQAILTNPGHTMRTTA